jgi:predicted DCC family thiol-disulfide oxidoreductase YuxK
VRGAAPRRAAPAGDPLHVYVDGECRLCAGAAAWALARDRAGRLALVPFQDPAARARLGPERAARAAEELHVWSATGGVETGSDAVAALLRRLPGWGWAGACLGAPPVRPLARALYRAVARRRARLGAARCALPGVPPVTAATPPTEPR